VYTVNTYGMIMSRGPGYVQRYLTGLVLGSDKPMTFADILACAFAEGSYEADMIKELGKGKVAIVRSFRRALKKLVDDNTLIAIGEGGPGDPKRYWRNPMLLALFGSEGQYEEAMAALEAEPGGKAAMDEAARAMFKSFKSDH
jgi:hypothetical protein